MATLSKSAFDVQYVHHEQRWRVEASYTVAFKLHEIDHWFVEEVALYRLVEDEPRVSPSWGDRPEDKREQVLVLSRDPFRPRDHMVGRMPPNHRTQVALDRRWRVQMPRDSGVVPALHQLPKNTRVTALARVSPLLPSEDITGPLEVHTLDHAADPYNLTCDSLITIKHPGS